MGWWQRIRATKKVAAKATHKEYELYALAEQKSNSFDQVIYIVRGVFDRLNRR